MRSKKGWGSVSDERDEADDDFVFAETAGNEAVPVPR